MKMRKAVPMFILFITGHLCNNMNVAAGTTSYSLSPEETTAKSHSFTSGPKFTQTPQSESMLHENQRTTEPENRGTEVPERLPTIVAGVSISLVLIFLLVIIGVCYARRRSKGSSAAMNSVPSGEPGVSLKKMSTHENHREWPFERAL